MSQVSFPERARNATETLGYLCGSIFIVPAAAVGGLYPVNRILGAASFSTLSFPSGGWQFLLYLPFLIAAGVAVIRRSWPIAIMALAGLVLLLSAPPQLGGAVRLSQYQDRLGPSDYNASVAQRIQALHARHLGMKSGFNALFIDEVDVDKLMELDRIASFAVDAWKRGLEGTAITQNWHSRITQLMWSRERLLTYSHCSPSYFAFQSCADDVRRRSAGLAAQISVLRRFVDTLETLTTKPTASFEIAVSATIVAQIELENAERMVEEMQVFTKAFFYLAAASVAFAIMMYFSGFRALPFAVVLLCTAALPVVLRHFYGASPDYYALIVDLYPAAILLSSALALRFLYRAYLDNSVVCKRFSKVKLVSAAAVATLVWLPFPIVIFGYHYLGESIYEWTSDALYCRTNSIDYCRAVGPNFPIFDSDPSRDTLRVDINSAIRRQLAQLELNASKAAEIARSGGQAGVAEARNQILGTLNQALPEDLHGIFPGLKPPANCSLLRLELECFVKRAVLKQLNKAYQKRRQNFLQRVGDKLHAAEKSFTGTASSVEAGFKSVIRGEANLAATHATGLVDLSFVGLNILSVSQNVVLFLVAIRAFLLCFGRILYHEKDSSVWPQPYFPLTHDTFISKASPTVEKFSDGCPVDPGVLPLFSSSSHSAENAHQITLFIPPLGMRWPFRRIANGCWFLKDVRHISNQQPVSYPNTSGSRYVVWSLPPQTRVYFRWDQFVAMSQTLKLGKTTSLRIGGLTMGTLMHSYVESGQTPGILIQESKSQVRLSRNSSDPAIVYPYEFMSWENGSSFRLVSPSNYVPIYFDVPKLDIHINDEAAMNTRRGSKLYLLVELAKLLRP